MERFWMRENDDRALLTIGVDYPAIPETKSYTTERDRWLDFDYRVDRALLEVDLKEYVAETFPVFEPNLGPDIVSTIFGLNLEFEPSTSWGSPVVETIEQIMAIEPTFDAELWQAVTRLQQMGLEAGRGRWITLFTDLHPNMDVPSALMGPEALCMAIADEPEAVARVLKQVTVTCLEAYQRQIAPLVEEGLPIGCWMRALSRCRTHAPQCDFSAMIGPLFFQQHVLPSIREEMALADRNIYHLDGPSALHHLDALLHVPEIDAIQWVYGAGNGPARKWLPVYRRILNAGKAIRVEAEDVEDIRCLSEELGSKGVWFVANFSAPDREMAERLVRLISPPGLLPSQ
jgi:hypothetical protein